MKTTIRKAAQIGLGAAATLCMATMIHAQTGTLVYDNFGTPLNEAVSRSDFSQIGDEITLDTTGLGPGSIRVTQFSFEYTGLAADSGTATLRFYANDDAGAPGTELFSLAGLALDQGVNGFTVSDLDVTVPGNFTWAMEFSSPGDVALNIFDPPTVGSSFSDYWAFDGSDWQTIAITAGPAAGAANFGAQVYAVPEPTTIALILGGLALLGFRFVRRRA